MDPRLRPASASRVATHRPPFEQAFGFEFEVVTEPNKERMAEINKAIEECRARGEDPSGLDFDVSYDQQDYVVYNRVCVLRPSPLAPDPRQIPKANLRWNEHLRIPLAEVMARADVAFSGGPPAAQG